MNASCLAHISDIEWAKCLANNSVTIHRLRLFLFSRARGLEHFCHFFLVGGARLSGTIYKKDLVRQK